MPGEKASHEFRKEQILSAACGVALQRGLDGVSVRRVAEAAGVSHGLIQFYFPKDELLEALLEWWLKRLAFAGDRIESACAHSPHDRLLGLIAHEVERLTANRESVELFFDYWLLGLRRPVIRERIRAELRRYREAFRAAVSSMLPTEDEGRVEVIAALAVSFLHGYGLQAAIDPRAIDPRGFRDEAAHFIEFLISKEPV